MSEIIELVRKGGHETELFACGSCGRVHSPRIYLASGEKALAAARQAAERCCQPEHCPRCQQAVESSGACDKCREAIRAERDLAMMNAAAQVAEAEYGNRPVYWEGYGEFDGYADDTDALRDWCEDTGTPLPERVWATRPTPLSFDSNQVVDSALEQGEHHESAGDNISNAQMNELGEFLRRWAAETKIVSYHIDYTRVVILGR